MNEKILEVKLAIMEVIIWKLLMKNLISDNEYEKIIELLGKEIGRQKIKLINSKMDMWFSESLHHNKIIFDSPIKYM